MVRRVLLLGLAGLALAGCITSVTGCRSVPHSSVYALGEEGDVEIYSDEQIVEAVKKWYRERGAAEPSRIVIKSKTPTSYIVTVGHPLKEVGIKIDPRTGQVGEIYPGL